MTRANRSGVRWPLVLAGGVVLVAAATIAVRTVPELAPVRRFARDAEEFAVHAPERVRELALDARSRFERARAAFTTVRSEAERTLTAQFEEAKQRGSIPSV